MSAYDRDEVLPLIYTKVASGRSLDRVLTDDEGMPSPSTFWRWHAEDAQVRDNLARAREVGVEKLLGECVDIADTPLFGEIVTRKPVIVDGILLEGVEAVEVRREDMLGHRKLQIETRYKYAQMIAPRKYGAKVALTGDGGGPIEIEQRVREDADAVASAIAGLAERARTARMADETER